MPIRFAQIPENFFSFAAHSPNSILLHTSRCDIENYRSYLFAGPSQIISTKKLDEIPEVFSRIEEALRKGNFVAGYFSYESGEHFERALSASNSPQNMPLAWFGVFARPCIFNHRSGSIDGVLPEGFSDGLRNDTRFAISGIQFDLAEDLYSSKIETIHEYIRSGETYQVNLTDKLTFKYSGSPIAMYKAFVARQPVPYSAYIHLGDQHILSFSPEMFFRIRNSEIVARPMKGTAQRGRTTEEDARIAEWLKNDSKNRSENVMIVDLLRNDLGRICEFGSMRADELFSVEKYDTLFQMVSTVSGKLRPGLAWYDIFKSIFPSGSITGAPKIRTMQIIKQLERQPRGVYTGAIGFFAPSGDSVFNVAIRTVLLNGGHGEMGIGGGITIDSRQQEEYQECLLKAKFLTHTLPSFALIETLLWDGQQYPLLDLHMRRLEDSARYFGFIFDCREARDILHTKAPRNDLGSSRKIRLMLSPDGQMKVEESKVASRAETGLVTLSPARTSSHNRFFYHKTTNRQFYNEWFDRAQRAGYDDILFFNERGEVTEGAISNVFAEIGGMLLTPPVASGLLPGVYRQHLLATNPRAAERVLTRQDLMCADSVYVCNAVRGLRKVTVAQAAFDNAAL
jgi:para-aminobenzoate synthetase / 4-amino-4-deoxychorismate lyase